MGLQSELQIEYGFGFCLWNCTDYSSTHIARDNPISIESKQKNCKISTNSAMQSQPNIKLTREDKSVQRM